MFKFDYKYLPWIIVAVLIIILVFSTRSCNSANEKLAIAEQNFFALSDSVRPIKNKIGQLEYEKGILFGDLSTIKKLNDSLYSELKNTEGTPKVIVKVVTETKLVEVPVYSSVQLEPGGLYKFLWKSDTSFTESDGLKIIGKNLFNIDTSTTPISIKNLITSIDSVSIKMGLIVKVVERDDKWVIQARSNFPGVEITDIQGAVIDPQKSFIQESPKNWGIGLQAGVGISTYGLTIPYVGVGISYNIIKF